MRGNVKAYLPPVWRFWIRSPETKNGPKSRLTSAVGGQSTAGVNLHGGNSDTPAADCCIFEPDTSDK